MAFVAINVIASIVVLIGSINWGLVGIFNWNLVSALFGEIPSIGSTIVYILVLLSALWLVFAVMYQRGKILYCRHYVHDSGKDKTHL